MGALMREGEQTANDCPICAGTGLVPVIEIADSGEPVVERDEPCPFCDVAPAIREMAE